MVDTTQNLTRKLQEKETELQVSVKRIHQLQLLLDSYGESGTTGNNTTINNNSATDNNSIFPTADLSVSTSSSLETSELPSRGTSAPVTPTRKQSIATVGSNTYYKSNKFVPSFPSSSSSTVIPNNRYLPSSNSSASSSFIKRPMMDHHTNIPFTEHAHVNTKRYTTKKDLFDELGNLNFTTINSQIILGIDCTKSNLWNGTISFQGKNLHDVSDPTVLNPYQQVISIVGETMGHLDVDNLIPVYGFGDKTSADISVFSFAENLPNKVCEGFEEVLECYKKRIPQVPLAGPTSFAPIIRMAIQHIQKFYTFTILLILADGQVTSVQETEAAIVEASKYPLSIICIGIGDGPWTEMKRFDDGLPKRKFDNFHFVELLEIENLAKEKEQSFKDMFVCSTLAEVPSQVAELRRLRMI